MKVLQGSAAAPPYMPEEFIFPVLLIDICPLSSYEKNLLSNQFLRPREIAKINFGNVK